MRTIVSGLAKLAKVGRPRIAEVRSWSGGQKSLEKAGGPRHWPGRWFTALLPSTSRLPCLTAFFLSLQICTFSPLPFSSYFSQCNIFTSDLCCFFPSQVKECSNCMKSQFVKRQRNNYQQLGIAEKMEQRIQLKSFRWLCSSDQGKHNPLFDKMTKYSPLFIQKISLTIS